MNLPTDDSRAGNQNPVMGGIQATWKDAPDGGPATDDGGTPSDDTLPGSVDADNAPLDAGEPVDADNSVLDAGETAAVAPVSPADAAAVTVGPAESQYGVILDNAYSTLLPRQVHVALHLQLPQESSELLTPAQSEAESLAQATAGSTTPTRIVTKEDFNLAWYAEAGDFGNNGKGGHNTHFLGFPEDPNSLFVDAINNTWTLPKTEDYSGKTSRIIVVVRDNRGGVAWAMATASMVTP